MNASLPEYLKERSSKVACNKKKLSSLGLGVNELQAFDSVLESKSVNNKTKKGQRFGSEWSYSGQENNSVDTFELKKMTDSLDAVEPNKK